MLNSKLHLVLLLSALLAAGLFSDAWLAKRRDAAKLASTLATQNAVLKRATDAEKQRDGQLASALAETETLKRAVETPRQSAAAIPSVLPPLPLPVKIQFSNLTPAHSPDVPDVGDSSGGTGDSVPNSAEVPLPDATLRIPQLDLKPLYDGLQDCRESLLQTESLKQSLADEKSRSDALAKERDAAIAAGHGGTFWARVRREAKWFAIGIVIGTTASAAARSGSSTHR